VFASDEADWVAGKVMPIPFAVVVPPAKTNAPVVLSLARIVPLVWKRRDAADLIIKSPASSAKTPLTEPACS
jgi:hypothetical protein